GFSLNKETIIFSPSGISFRDFKIQDSQKNTAKIDGTITTSDYRDFTLNLDLITANFRVLNTTADDNKLFYGKVNVNANVRVRGKIDQPSVDMQASLSDGSEFTYAVPQTQA